MATRPHEDRLLDLLIRWEEAHRQGRNLSPEELCAECPEHVDAMRQRMEAVRVVPPILDAASTAPGSGLANPDPRTTVDEPVLPEVLRASAVYRPRYRHARGGQGVVLAALEEELDRTVALKRVRPDGLHDATRRRRFLREAAITAQLQHPGIVPIYGLGQDDEGPFYTMPLIQGQTLDAAIREFHQDESLRRDIGRRTLRFRNLLQQFITVCNTVAYAHDQGVVHRDLKPSNIMLGPYGETLVMDWGLAKRVGSVDVSADMEAGAPTPTPSPEELTATGAVVGTPQYMSPEQATGEPVGPSSDVFSLGLVLYTILTGKTAFDRITPGEADPLKAVREAAVVPPSARGQKISPALEAVCLQALRPRPEDRYASAKALRADLDRWLADEPVSAWKDPLLTRAWREVRKHRTLATTAATVIVFGLFAFAVAYRREVNHSAGLAKAGAEINRKNASLEAANAKLDRANTDLIAANKESERWLGEAFQSIEEYYTAVGESVLRERPDLGDLRRKLLEKPRAFYERLATEYASARADDVRSRYRLARGRLSLGRILRMLGRGDQAQTQIRSAIDLVEDLTAPAPLPYRDTLAMGYYHLGNVLRDIGRTDDAKQAFSKGIEAFEWLIAIEPDVPKHRDDLAGSYINLGRALRETGRLADAEEAYTKAIAGYEALAATQPAVLDYQDRLALAYNNLGNALQDTARPAESERMIQKSLAVYESLVTQQPKVAGYREGLARAYNNFGISLYESRRSTEAAAMLTKSISAYRALVELQPNVPDYQHLLARGWNNLATALANAQQPAETEAALRRAVALYETLVARYPSVPDYRDGLAMTYLNLGGVIDGSTRGSEAEGILKKAIVVYEGMIADQPHRPAYRSRLSGALTNLGLVVAAQGRHEDATRHYRQAIGWQRPVFERQPDVNPFRQFLSGHYLNLAISLRALGRTDDAVEAVREVVKLWPGKADELYDAACALALCVPIGSNASHKQSVAGEAMKTLRMAVAAGCADGVRMGLDPDLAPLRDRADFRRLVLGLMDRAMPVNPFSP